MPLVREKASQGQAHTREEKGCVGVNYIIPFLFRQDCLNKMEACEENANDIRELFGAKE
jgi:translation elongation factor EF-Tu-like GTPase